MNANIFKKANRMVRVCDAAYLGVIDENGYPSVSTASVIKQQDIFHVYFATNPDANKALRIMKNKKASVCFRRDGDNVTLVGDAEVLIDQETKSNMWLDWFIEHFPKGETDPDYCIIKFTTKRVSLYVEGEIAAFNIDILLTVQSRCGLLCDGCTYREQFNCGKCLETNGHPFHGECPVALCCQGKGYKHCGECADMPCDLLLDYSCGDSEHSDNPKGARIEVCKAWAGC